MYSATDHAATARSYSATASAATRSAARKARQAAEAYAAAEHAREYGAWVTQRPDLWDMGASPAQLDARARLWAHVGDTYLRGSFAAGASAEHYRQLAGQYRELAARQAARIEQLADA